jgi:hypothetical protein
VLFTAGARPGSLRKDRVRSRHATPATTLNVDAHVFDEAEHRACPGVRERAVREPPPVDKCREGCRVITPDQGSGGLHGHQPISLVVSHERWRRLADNTGGGVRAGD